MKPYVSTGINSIGKGLANFGQGIQRLVTTEADPQELESLERDRLKREKLMKIEDKIQFMGGIKDRFMKQKMSFGQMAYNSEAKMKSLIAQAEHRLEVLDRTEDMKDKPDVRRLRTKTIKEANNNIQKASLQERQMVQYSNRSDKADQIIETVNLLNDELKNRYEITRDFNDLDSENMVKVMNIIGEIGTMLFDQNQPYNENLVHDKFGELQDIVLSQSIMDSSSELKLRDILARSENSQSEGGEMVDEVRNRLKAHIQEGGNKIKEKE